MDENILAYLLDELDDTTRSEVEKTVSENVELRRRMALLQGLLSPLQTDRIEITTPTSLVARTVSMVAEHIVTHALSEPAPAPPARPRSLFKAPQTPTEMVSEAETDQQILAPIFAPEADAPQPASLPTAPRERTAPATMPGWYRWDVIAIGVLSLSLIAVGIPALVKLRALSNRVNCADHMRALYGACSQFADVNNDQFPSITDAPPHQTAGSFVDILADAQLLPANASFCPADPLVANHKTNYAYCLGYRSPQGELVGLSRQQRDLYVDFEKLLLLANRALPDADGSPRTDGEILSGHGAYANVMYVTGEVMYVNKPFVGVKRDNIYLNRNSQVRAGVSWDDTVLGDPEAQP